MIRVRQSFRLEAVRSETKATLVSLEAKKGVFHFFLAKHEISFAKRNDKMRKNLKKMIRRRRIATGAALIRSTVHTVCCHLARL
jgi:hypothetical protein